MNGTYGLIAEQGFYCVLAAIVLIVVEVAIRTKNMKDKDGTE